MSDPRIRVNPGEKTQYGVEVTYEQPFFEGRNVDPEFFKTPLPRWFAFDTAEQRDRFLLDNEWLLWRKVAYQLELMNQPHSEADARKWCIDNDMDPDEVKRAHGVASVRLARRRAIESYSKWIDEDDPTNPL